MEVEQIQKLHPGLFHCPYKEVERLMPEIFPIVQECPADYLIDSVLDVKIHMLMPNQWPCIPNWHHDLVPRTKVGTQDYTAVNTHKKMYLWLSGAPFTEFSDGEFIKPRSWHGFTQLDSHRGTMSTIFTWRIFIRVAPPEFISVGIPDQWLRRHSQVYLDVNNFKW